MQSKAKKLSLGGILLALTVITLFVESIAPTNKLSLYILSSFFVSVVIIELGVGTGWMFYFSSVVLSVVVVQDKMALIPYVLYFGLYGIAKFFIEKLNMLILEYALKLLFSNTILFIVYFLFRQLLLENVKVDFPLWILLIPAQIVFIIYDYVYTLFINYYCNKIKNLLGIK